MALLILYLIWSGYEDALKDANTTTLNYVSIIEARLEATLRRADSSLQLIIKGLPVAALDQQAVPRNKGAIIKHLQIHLANFPELANFRVVDAKGDTLYTSSPIGSGVKVNISDRSHFRHLRDNPKSELVFSEVLLSRYRNHKTVIFARGLWDERGVFRGIVTAGINFDYFLALFKTLNLGTGGSASIHQSELFDLITSWPPVDGAINRPIALSNLWIAALARGQTTISTADASSNGEDIDHLYSVKLLEGYPFAVAVALARDEVLAGWRTRNLPVGLVSLLLLVLLLVYVLRIWRMESAHALYASIVDSTNDAIVARDLSRRIISWNRAAERLFGWSAAEAMGRHAFLIMPSTLHKKVIENRARRKEGEYVVDRDTVRIAKDGRRIPVAFLQSPIRDIDGTLIGYSAVYVDTTERKRAEATLAHFAEIVKNSQDAIISCDFHSRVVLSWNAAAVRMFGYTEHEVLGKTLDFIIPEDQMETVTQVRKKLVAREAVSSYDTVRLDREGRRIDVSIAQSHMTDPAGRVVGVSLVFRDIRERKLSEALLLAAKAEAEEANHAKSRFLAAASHDLRQPLAALSLYVGALERSPVNRREQLVAHIGECVENLSDLMADIFDLSKLDAGAVKVDATDFVVVEMFASLKTIFSVEAASKNLRLRFRPCTLLTRTDRHLMQRLLGNLIGNAIRFTRSGGVLVACRRHAEKRWIEVWDTGIGIADDKSGFIFEEFTQLGDEARNRGSGLGLSIVAKTAKLLGLEIRWHSRVGRGSLFAIELPMALNIAPKTVSAAPMTARHFRIALVEDNTQMLQALTLALSGNGHEVVPATTVDALLAMLAGARPEIILSDYLLAGGETGRDVIAAVRREFGESLPAIIFTGNTDQNLEQSMTEQGITVVYKPVGIDTLELVINDIAARPA